MSAGLEPGGALRPRWKSTSATLMRTFVLALLGWGTALLPAIDSKAIGGGAGLGSIYAVSERNISSAEGYFIGAKNITGVKDSGTNTDRFTLQLNTNSFNAYDSGLCGGNTGCTGFVQFLYGNSGSGYGSIGIEYWLLDVDSCPSSWKRVASANNRYKCYIDTVPVGVIVPEIKTASGNQITDLSRISIRAQTFNGIDTVTLNQDGQRIESSSYKSVFFSKSSQGWKQAEFNVYGAGGGSTINFNNGATLAIGLRINDGSSSAPVCAISKGTVETNNLNLDSPCCAYGGAQPSIAFVESTSINTRNFTCSDLAPNPSKAYDFYIVTPSSGPGGSIDPDTPFYVSRDQRTSFRITPDNNYKIASIGGTCGGTHDDLPGFDRFVINPASANCTVVAAFTSTTQPPPTVTASVGSGSGTISPQGAATVAQGTSKTYTLTPASGSVIASVGGTCGGTLNNNIFTTKPITTSCTVVANFGHTVTSSVGSGSGTISPLGTATVTHGMTKSYTLMPASGSTITSVGGTCGGTLSGNTFITQAITANCTVVATFTSCSVTTSTSGGGTISPPGGAVSCGSTRSFTITPASGYVLASVGGTCGGTLSGISYTTKPITTHCTVVANFGHTVTSSVGSGSGTISPLGTATVTHGMTKSYTLMPASGSAITSVGGTCGGTLNGNTFTTKPITANCTVSATFAPVGYTVGGTVNCQGCSVTLKLDGTNPTSMQTLIASGNFTFREPLQRGSNWAVSMATLPAGLTCTISNGWGSNISAPVTNVNVTCVTPPSGTVNISGTARVGYTLTAYPSGFIPTPDSYTYQWLRNGASIAGATASTYLITSADAGQQISARVTAKKAGSPDRTATSNPLTVTVDPTISGTLSGLSGSVTLKLEGTNPTSTQTRTLTTNGSFTFVMPLQSGSNWTVSVSAQPAGQTCSVTNGSGSNTRANVTNVNVTCITPPPGPVLSNWSVSNITSTSAAFTVTSNQPSNGYWLLRLASQAAPTPDQVGWGGNWDHMTVNTPFTRTLSGLTPNTAYRLYFLAAGVAGESDLLALPFTTLR